LLSSCSVCKCIVFIIGFCWSAAHCSSISWRHLKQHLLHARLSCLLKNAAICYSIGKHVLSSCCRWHFPSPYYSTLFQAKNVSVQISVLDATPFVPTYSHPTPNTAYYHSEFQARVRQWVEAICACMDLDTARQAIH